MYAEFKERAEYVSFSKIIDKISTVHEDLEKKVELHIVFISEIN